MPQAGPSSTMTDTPVTTAAEQRQRLRQTALQARQALTPEQWQAHSSRLQQHLLLLLRHVLQHHPLHILGFYWPIKQEFDARDLILQLLAEDTKLRACLPVVLGPGQPLGFRHWHPASLMQTDRYGIAYPASGEWLQPELLLIPLNAFDAQGYRLGYGSGYYDRTLVAARPRPLCIGVGFELGRVDSILPSAHDIPLDAIITETGGQFHGPLLGTPAT